MSGQPTNQDNPPAYGSVSDQPPPPPPHTAAPPVVANPAPPSEPPPPYGGYPQPGQTPPPPNWGVPSGPPPKYEPSKEADAAARPGPPPPPPPHHPYVAPPYPAPGYQAAGGFPQQAVFLAPDGGWGSTSRTIQCPYCQTVVTTSTNFRPGGLTWLACGIICLFGCWAGCCLLPFCMPEMQDVEHICPSCGKTVATYHRI